MTINPTSVLRLGHPNLGREVVDAENNSVGTVSDVLYDDTSNEPRWLVVDPGVFRSARYVPIDGSYTATNGDLVIPYDRKWVRAAPKATSNHVMTAPEESALDHHYDTEHGQRRAS